MSIASFVQVLLRYRILHVAYWCYALFAAVHELRIQRPAAAYATYNILDAINETAFAALAVYSCLGWGMARFRRTEIGLMLAASSIGFIILSALLAVVVQKSYVLLLTPGHVVHPSGTVLITFVARLVDIGTVTLGFLIIYLVRHYYLKDRHHRRVEQERVLSELAFLKAQMNPHFLFNALNSIYVLMKEDMPLAERTLLRFSALLRYQLYDCAGERTTMDKEVDCLRDYVELERVRNGNDLLITFSAPDHVPSRPIAPFLLLPFVENAFKHVARPAQASARVGLVCDLRGAQLRFTVTNTCDPPPSTVNGEGGGIGLQNVKRRLALLYPERHRLHIDRSAGSYSVTLELDLENDALPGGGR